MAGMILGFEIIGLILMNPSKMKENEEKIPNANFTDRSIKETLKMKEFWCLWTYLMAIRDAHCLKITQNVAFEFLNSGIFHQFLTKVTSLVTLFDLKL